MLVNRKKRREAITDLKVGDVLFARPMHWQHEETYRQSVIVLIDVGENLQGITGVIINKMSNFNVNDALPELEHAAPLYYGGPIDKKRISYIHTNSDLLGRIDLGEGLYWGGEYDDLLLRHEQNTMDMKNIRFMAGFTKWNRDMLEDEVQHNKWWILENLTPDMIFRCASDVLWGATLAKRNYMYGLFHLHPDPSNN